MLRDVITGEGPVEGGASVNQLAQVASMLVARVRDEDPAENAAWLARLLPDPGSWFQLSFVLAAAVPDDRTWSQLTAWTRRKPNRKPIFRPDGRLYHPRKPGLRAHAWQDDDCDGVIVFGTLDVKEAEAFALESAVYWRGEPGAVTKGTPGWYRDRFNNGERRWERDEKRGAPGVSFRWVPRDADLAPAGTP